MSTRPDIDELYEQFCVDDILDRIEDWVNDSREASEVFYAHEDFAEQVLVPTGTPVTPWKEWTRERKLIFSGWLRSKTTDPYGFLDWLQCEWEDWYESYGLREEEDDD